MRSFTWRKRAEILEEAYSLPANINATARKYGVQTHQIRNWRRTSEKISERGELNMAATRWLQKKRKIRTTAYDNIYADLKARLLDLRERGRPVSVRLMREELIRMTPDSGLSMSAIDQRLRR